MIRVNQEAAARLPGAHGLVVVPGATHLFDEPGALGEAVRLGVRTAAPLDPG